MVVLSGLWRWIGLRCRCVGAPGLWYVMRDYQRDRVLTLIDPERDPLGAGWNIIQSTAIGSGGVFGKGAVRGHSPISISCPRKPTSSSQSSPRNSD